MNEALEVVWELSPFGLTVMRAIRDHSGSIYDFSLLWGNRVAAKALDRSVEELSTGRCYRHVFVGPVFVAALQRMKHAAESGEPYGFSAVYGADEVAFDTYVWPTGDILACLLTESISPNEQLAQAREVIESQRGALRQARNVEKLRNALERIERDSSIS